MFKLIHQDKNTKARLGKITTEHGEFDTPAFMPVALLAIHCRHSIGHCQHSSYSALGCPSGCIL
jgi:tRNA-guanine family transglycosylase